MFYNSCTHPCNEILLSTPPEGVYEAFPPDPVLEQESEPLLQEQDGDG